MGETQHAYATRDVETGAQDNVLSFEPFSKKDPGEVESRLPDSSKSEGQSGSHNGTDLVSNKEKEPHSQREAVIRPQKAGKIDFKSLSNRPRFPGAGPWGAAKGNPLSPPGRSRARDRSSRRAGRSERGHQQLYRLTISNARPNPTIGIAYPQQKITPPKKVEADRGPVLGSYRFHVPSLPERDLKLPEEELSFACCFSEAPTSHISSNYTSQATTACPNHGQLPYLEFQANGSNLWPSPEKGYPGANNGLPKPSPHCLGPLSFQYPFSPLPSSASDPFQGEADPQDYVDNISLATSQASHGAFAFHSSSRDWKEEVLGNGSYDNVESRTYGLTPPPAPFHLPQTPGHLPCYKGRNGPSTDHNGAISPSGAIDQVPSTFQENQAVFPPSLHASSTPKAVGKRHSSLSKDGVASQRILDVGSSLRRNGLPVTLPQVHFQNKAFNEASSLVPFEKSLSSSVQAHPRLLQAWEGGKKTYSPMEPSSAGCPSPEGSQISFGYHSGLGKKAWQHLPLTCGVPGQNRLELSRKLASQKPLFPLSTSEWEGSKKLPQSPTSYPSKALVAEDLSPQSCSSASSICFEGSTDVEMSKSTTFFLSVSPARPPIPSHHPPSPSLGLPPSTLTPSPKGSPLPSPTPNLNSSCSSPSLTSSSPPGHSFEDEAALAASTFFHHQGHHPKDGSKPFQASELLGASSVPYQMASPIKAFHQELLYKGVSVDSHFPKSNVEASKRFPEGFESELPPPPYPYSSSRHFLASSLSSTSLDQLDVFLTCKQCDQNFSNLSSFLEHRQFCGSHVVLQGQAKDSSRGAEVKKQHHASPESAKHTQTSLGVLLPPDPHLQLLALNKTMDFLVDIEGKGESRDDPLKLNQLNGFPGSFLPLNTSDLEIDDAKLDSLITEALNGLGYQSDNPEIDSSFIDVFADEDLVSVKATNAGGTPFKAKENLTLGKKAKHVGMDESVKMLNCCDNHPSGELAKSRTSKQPTERGTNWLSDFGEERHETFKSRELPLNKALEPTIFGAAEDDTSAQQKAGKKNSRGPLLPMKQGSQTMSDLRLTKNLPCASPRSELKPDGTHSLAESTTLSKKDVKKRKLRSGSWSKELIHKIVQQKNKFHKLHSQNSKAVSLSLLTNRLLPETKDNKFCEYEYMSESDEERVEYAKRHCRRKLGSRFSGRLRSSLNRRNQGRGGREKGTEPIWRYGPRRGQEEPKRLANKELERTDGPVARVRRRSSRSSTSSCQSLSMSSETSNSPQSTERGDSDTEKETEQRKQFLQISRCVGPLNVPENETIRRSHSIGSDFPGTPSTVDPPQTQPVDNQKFQTDNPSIPQDTALNQDEGVLQSREKPHHPEATAGKGPTVVLSPEGSDQYHGAFCCDIEKPRMMPKDADGAGGHHCPRYAANKGGILKNPVEELTGSPSVGKHSIPNEKSTSYEQVDLKDLKNQQELIMPISCFSDNPGSREIPGKGVNTFLDAANAFYDCKELSHSYETPSLFLGPAAMEPSPNENAYLCQGDFDVPSFKEKHDGILACESDNAQSKVPSPLNFDSSSVFLEFPIAEFDANLYDSVASSKNNYIPFECANHQLSKIIPFDQQYSSFLPEKDWTLMEDVSPILTEDTPQIPRLSVEKPTAKRHSSEINLLSLSNQLSDYNVPFMSGLSEDELEIKRLVTELESQLQANKLTLQASEEDQASVNHISMEAKESTCELLSLRLNQEQDGKGLFLLEAEYENAKLLSTEPFSCENIANEKTPLPALDTKYGSPNDPWPCAGSFSLLRSAPDLILVGPFSPQGHQDKIAENLKDIEISAEADFGEIKNASTRILPDSCLEEVSSSSRAPDYPEEVIQSPDSIFPRSLEDSDLNSHENLPLRPDVFPKLLSEEKTCDSPTELESYGHEFPQLDPEFDLQDTLESDENLSSSAQNKNPETHPPDKLETTTLFQNNEDEHLGNNEETGSQTVCQTLMLDAKADIGDNPHFDTLTFSKEVDGEVVFKSTTQEKAGNPLQQLQLFVARTVKNNEEELVSSSLPAQHPVAHLPSCQSLPPEPEEELMDQQQNEEVASGPMLGNKRETLLKKTEKLAEFPNKLLSEPEKETEHFDEWASDVSKDSAPLNPAQCTNVVQQQHLKVECLEVNGGATQADDISLESAGDTSQIPPRGSLSDPQDLETRSNLENEDSALNENVKKSSDCMEESIPEDQILRNDPKAGQSKARKRKGLQFTCDICSTSFRSKTGLMRHKAVKHQKKDSVALPDDNSAPLEKALKTSKVFPKKSIKPFTQEKSSNSELSKTESEVPPVHCNTTGITNDHSLTTVTEEPGDGPEEQIQVCLPLLPQQSLTNELENTVEKMPSAQRTAGPPLPQNAGGHREEGEELGQEEHSQERWPSGSVKGGEDELNQKPSKKGFSEEMNEPWKREELQPQNGESAVDPAVKPDLPSLFDDDSTFSQLFPRNDEFARRKCTRVYGKRSKKPKAVSEIIAKPEGTPDPFTIRMASDLGENSSFCVTREDPCEYDTISVDDALMLNMCHGSKAMSGDVNSRPTKETAQQLDTGQKEEVKDLKNSSVFLCKESPTGSLPCFKSWNNLEKATENNSSEGPLHNSSVQLPYGHSGAEDNPELPDLKEKSYSTKEKTLSAFPTIDMEMLNMKFETSDVCFCTTGEDQLSPTKHDEGTLGFKRTSLLQAKPVKRKLEEGKTGKTRNDLNLKNKDKQYKCKVCFQWFLTLGELDFHKLSHNPSPPPTCYMCVQRKFSSREQLRDHLKEKHAKNKAGLWACGMCLKEISDVWMYNEHLREHATQFARKGQAQKSVLGLAFSEEDAAVTHFLNSIICRKPSKISKQAEGGNGAPAGSEIKGPKEFSGQETVVQKDLPEIPFRIRPPTASLKVPAVPSPDPAPKVEGAQKSVPIHPECKDPSRDCHHCGKQFPKPFKLQRHLVVHSLQKIFLCHKCPMFYQETKELRSHLSQEHEIAEEADIKHTTLYACELCADVMHVIKKSFICSTCNYTFSKKEQYDRHMEKHLVGSSKTFRFRGVMRPGPFAKYGEEGIKEETRWNSNPDLNGTAPQEAVNKLHLPETSFPELPLKDKTSLSTLNRSAKEVPSKKVIGGQANAEDTPGIHCSLDGAEEVQMCPLLRDKAFPEMDTTAHPKDTSSSVGAKETELSLVRPVSGHLQGEGASAQSKNHHSELNKFPERPAANRLANPHPKKPKEHNKSSHRGSPASRENIEGDGSKKRKGRVQDSVKGDSVKKADWPTTEALAFSPRRRGTHANKQAPKLKGSVTDGQVRKLGLDQGFQKKVEMGQANGELRRKKEILGSKALYPLLTKDPSASLPSSLNRRRAVQGAKVPTSHSYRTAESQTHLLNQLFGQKLTSFKIPLRRDTSE
ncbi:zinc finger protein 469 [Protobothrops mucrosquamatus]|uniref:zinc finger protein 469 n=1 Tax=Protobothrops mucrosquamatus TaxID=103944 RepID=UPI0010FB0F21|nr:zinc finger protein 469 [Protobothrops mucrosquamatus]